MERFSLENSTTLENWIELRRWKFRQSQFVRHDRFMFCHLLARWKIFVRCFAYRRSLLVWLVIDSITEQGLIPLNEKVNWKFLHVSSFLKTTFLRVYNTRQYQISWMNKGEIKHIGCKLERMYYAIPFTIYIYIYYLRETLWNFSSIARKKVLYNPVRTTWNSSLLRKTRSSSMHVLFNKVIIWKKFLEFRCELLQQQNASQQNSLRILISANTRRYIIMSRMRAFRGKLPRSILW